MLILELFGVGGAVPLRTFQMQFVFDMLCYSILVYTSSDVHSA